MYKVLCFTAQRKRVLSDHFWYPNCSLTCPSRNCVNLLSIESLEQLADHPNAPPQLRPGWFTSASKSSLIILSFTPSSPLSLSYGTCTTQNVLSRIIVRSVALTVPSKFTSLLTYPTVNKSLRDCARSRALIIPS